MAVTEFGNSSAQNVNIWSKTTMREALKGTYFFKKFLGKDEYSIIQRITDLEKSAGDTLKYDLLMQMTGAGVTGDNKLKGNEEALTYYQDSIVIDQLRHAHAFKRMSQKRTLHDLRKAASRNLGMWWSTKWEEYMFRYLCGDTTMSHAQTATAPDSTHYILSGDVSSTGVIATDEASLGANDQLKLEDLDYAKEKAITNTPPMRPVKIEGDEYFVMVMHPYSVTDLKLNLGGSTAAKWQEIQMYANVRGLKNPIFTGSLGVYNKIIMYESHKIFTPTTSVRRNVMLGAQAGTFALGNAYDKIDQRKVGNENFLSWDEESDDYGNEKGVAAGCIFGLKKTLFNSKDFGTMVISSYSAAHA
uniref:Putative major capsid protein n=2 Tax=viral metagenome TaxID=1070528 RepID=A0A6M3X826_9ZZZZ